MDTNLAPYATDIILDQIHKDGFSTGESRAFDSRCGMVWIIDASKDGECWVMTCPSRYEAAVELWIALGFDTEE